MRASEKHLSLSPMSFLICGHLNVRSLTRHLNAIGDVIQRSNFDILCLSETWLTGDILESDIDIGGYSFVRCDRRGRGGGVGMYIKSNIKFELLQSSTDIEQLWVRFNTCSGAIACCVAYRSQIVNYKDFWNVFENTLSDVLPTLIGLYVWAILTLTCWTWIVT